MRTICEVLREIHDRIDQDNEEIVSRLMEATHMAKRMNKKLTEYKPNWDDGFFEPNTYIEQKTRMRGWVES